VLLGFPGETDEDIEQVLDFLAAVKFDQVGSYRYSPEEGTAGADMAITVDPEEVADYEARLLDLQVDIALDRQRLRLGKQHRIVVDKIEDVDMWQDVLDDLTERVDDVDHHWLTNASTIAVGRSDHQAYEMDGVVLLDGEGRTPGEWLEARWTAVSAFDAAAVPVTSSEDK
jgi:ribosomal protein S12 methylthiotransferase